MYVCKPPGVREITSSWNANISLYLKEILVKATCHSCHVIQDHLQRAVHLWIGCLAGRLCKEGKVVKKLVKKVFVFLLNVNL